MIKARQSSLLPKNLDRLGPTARSRREPSIDRAAVALRANNHAIESVDRQDDACEHNPANNPKLVHGAHRILAGSKQFGETSIP
jgi:hypothetical protein